MEVAVPVPGTSNETTCLPGDCAGDVSCVRDEDFKLIRADREEGNQRYLISEFSNF
jgi:hypothetical protein